jgi:dTDP-4-amino-4,6-dideoxygalactose transaminase
VTIDQSKRLIRLPLWAGLTETQQMRVVDIFSALVK